MVRQAVFGAPLGHGTLSGGDDDRRRKDAGIATVADLAGKRVNIGSRRTGSRAAWGLLEQALGWKRSDLGAVMDLRPATANQALCANTLDASIQMVGNPSAGIGKSLETCDLQLVSVARPVVDKLLAANPYLRAATIPGAAYGQAADTETFGVTAILMATDRTPDRVVEAVTLGMIDHLGESRERFPVLRDAQLQEMLAGAREAAPQHPGVALALQGRRSQRAKGRTGRRWDGELRHDPGRGNALRRIRLDAETVRAEAGALTATCGAASTWTRRCRRRGRDPQHALGRALTGRATRDGRGLRRRRSAATSRSSWARRLGTGERRAPGLRLRRRARPIS